MSMSEDCHGIVKQIIAKHQTHSLSGIWAWYVNSDYADIYVRLITNIKVRKEPTVVIARIEVDEPRKGYLKCLLEELYKTDYHLEFECILNKDLEAYLLTQGFKYIEPVGHDVHMRREYHD